MGNFYTNITLKGPNQARIINYLKKERRQAYISPSVLSCTVIYDLATEDQDTQILDGLAQNLSRRLSCPALSALNHDDDILILKAYDAGKLVFEYNSDPGYFEGESREPILRGVRRLLPLLGTAAATGKVVETLSEGMSGMVVAQHAALTGALGLPVWAAGFGYRYLAEGEMPEGLKPSSMKHVGPRHSVATNTVPAGRTGFIWILEFSAVKPADPESSLYIRIKVLMRSAAGDQCHLDAPPVNTGGAIAYLETFKSYAHQGWPGTLLKVAVVPFPKKLSTAAAKVAAKARELGYGLIEEKKGKSRK